MKILALDMDIDDILLLIVFNELGNYGDLTFIDFKCADINSIFRPSFQNVFGWKAQDDNDMDRFKYTEEVVAMVTSIHEYFAELSYVECRM